MSSPPSFSSRAFGLSLGAAALGALACMWKAWCDFPFYAWNEIRLAPAFAVRHGLNPYPLLGDGPLTTWIYGPIGLLINLPATFAPSAASAVQAAAVINALVILAPLAIIFFASAELRARGMTTCFLALALSVLLLPSPNLALQVADHSAIACGLLSCWYLARQSNPRGSRLAIAAAFCALAVWSKQIAVFLVPAQLIFLARGSGLRTATQYFAWFTGFSLLALGVFAWAFGFPNLWLNLVAIPGRLPWAPFVGRLALRPWSLLAQIVVPAGALFVLYRARFWPTREREGGRFFQLGALAFLAMLPVGLAAFFKIGGDTNLLHSWDYLLPAGLLLWLSADRVLPSAPVRVFAVTVFALAIRGADLVSLPVRPFTRQFDAAVELTRLYPRTIWFPQNPLITFYTDRRLWHSEDGILTRYVAEQRRREPDLNGHLLGSLRHHLPDPLRAIAYPASVAIPSALPLLPEFREKSPSRYWTIYTPA
ncbi:MAG: hypothetical protein ABIZ49_08665, partial [Opitutaceae bacterium]